MFYRSSYVVLGLTNTIVVFYTSIFKLTHLMEFFEGHQLFFEVFAVEILEVVKAKNLVILQLFL